MKCIHCGNDANYKDRGGRRCPTCGKAFAFEPKDGDPVTDPLFKAAVDAVSANGRLRWGAENLWYEVCRRAGKRKPPPAGCAAVAGLVAVPMLAIGLFAKDAGAPLAIGVVLTVLSGLFLFSHLKTRTVTIPKATFDSLFTRWCATHGSPAGLIVRPKEPVRPRGEEPDLGDYSFDRAVICDRARTVDLLLANNFHFEHNCAVLVVGGYPAGAFETVRTMLRRNPRLEVFVLHDASGHGCRLAHRLANDPAWFKGLVPVVDVGLRPAQARALRKAGVFLPSQEDVAVADGITAEEAVWLSRYNLEVAAIKPEQVLKRLFRAMSRRLEKDGTSRATDTSATSGDGGGTGSTWDESGDGEGRSGAGVELDADSFSADAGDGDGGGDSFG